NQVGMRAVCIDALRARSLRRIRNKRLNRPKFRTRLIDCLVVDVLLDKIAKTQSRDFSSQADATLSYACHVFRSHCGALRCGGVPASSRRRAARPRSTGCDWQME